MTESAQRFDWFYVNDANPATLAETENRLSEMSVGATTTIRGWVVTRWAKDSWEVETWARNTGVGLETTAEALCSSTNAR